MADHAPDPPEQAQPRPDLIASGRTADEQAAWLDAGRRLFAAECRFFFAAQRIDQ
jgi:hypothetical protein